MNTRNLVWFRQDLRITDHPALHQASLVGCVLPIYILDQSPLGKASRWWLCQSLAKLNQKLDSHLHFYEGDPKELIPRIVKENSIEQLYWNQCIEPWHRQDEVWLKNYFEPMGIPCNTFLGSLLSDPGATLKDNHQPYKVFTPYYKKYFLPGVEIRLPLESPKSIVWLNLHNPSNPESIALANKTDEALFKEYWSIGEDAAQEKIHSFVEGGLMGYREERNIPSVPSSTLSPHLHFGELSPHQVWHAVRESSAPFSDKECFLTELVWREFANYTLYHFSELPQKNLHEKFDAFPWKNATAIHSWEQGQTGYPLVDAGMRELLHTGFMHNRLRMIVGSFLVKNLMIHWHYGQAWFFEHLVDADLANNSFNWQWVAGSGCDAAPYFRIFNPITQGEKIDPTGEYVRRFIPELANLTNKYLFCPWKAPKETLERAGIILGTTYPEPMVQLEDSRKEALSAFSSLKSSC